MQIDPKVWRYLCRSVNPDVIGWLAHVEGVLLKEMRRTHGRDFPGFTLRLTPP